MAKKTRTDAGRTVASAFLPVEQAAQSNAADAAKCLATLIEQRTRAQLPANYGADVLRRHDGGWWQGIGTGLAAGIKLTPLIFVAYLALTGRVRAAVTAVGVFALTVAAGFIWLPARSRTFWLGGVFYDQSRIGNPANPSDQSLAGAIARLAGTGDPPRTWWLVAALTVGLAGLAVAVWAHRRGHLHRKGSARRSASPGR